MINESDLMESVFLGAMKLLLGMYCESCKLHLKDLTKKMAFYHKLYHTRDSFKCNFCNHVFYSEDLLYFHLLKCHFSEPVCILK